METAPGCLTRQTTSPRSISSHKRKAAPFFITAPARPRHLRPVAQEPKVASATKDMQQDSRTSTAGRMASDQVPGKEAPEQGLAPEQELKMLKGNGEPPLQMSHASLEPDLSTSPSLGLVLPSLMITSPGDAQPPATSAASPSDYSWSCDSPLKTATNIDFADAGPPTPIARSSSRRP